MTKKDNGVNPVNGENLFELFQRTRDKIQYIKDQGYDVVEMWEYTELAWPIPESWHGMLSPDKLFMVALFALPDIDWF